MNTKFKLNVEAYHKSGIKHHFDAPYEVDVPMDEWLTNFREVLFKSLRDLDTQIQIGDCIIRLGEYSAFRITGELSWVD